MLLTGLPSDRLTSLDRRFFAGGPDPAAPFHDYEELGYECWVLADDTVRFQAQAIQPRLSVGSGEPGHRDARATVG